MSFQHYIGVALALVLVNTEAISAATDEASSRLLRDYDRRICKNEPSCDLTNSVQKDRLTLKKRNCMCDFECSEHGDCCTDSQYFNAEPSDRKYYCHPYSEVYVVVNCAADYQNRTVIANCEKAAQPLEENDFDLVIPVTNVGKRVTYANRYCALCNNDREYESWEFYAGCGESADAGTSIASSAPSGAVQPGRTFPASTQKSQPAARVSRPQPDSGKKYDTSTKTNVISDDFVSGCKSPNAPCRDDYKPAVTPHPVARVPNYEYPQPDSGKKYDTSTKTNVISDDFVSGCRSPNAPCRDADYKPAVTPPAPSVPNYEYHKLAPKNDYWVGDSRNAMVNIRIEIGGRFKRQQRGESGGSKKINYKKYEAVIDDLIKKARYDGRSKNFVVTSSDGKNLVCRFNATYPKTMEDAVRFCVPNLVSECGGGGSVAGGSASACPAYTSIVYDTKSRTAYRNRECARCNGIQDDKKLTGCPTDQTRAAASKDLAKTGKKSQDADLEKLSQNSAISFDS